MTVKIDCFSVWGFEDLSFEELARGSWLQSYDAWQENAWLAPYFSS